MKRWLTKTFGKSWKTTVSAYTLAALTAVQPFLTETVDFTNKYERNKYLVRLLFAAGIAVFGRQSADSTQVKEAHQQIQQIKNNE